MINKKGSYISPAKRKAGIKTPTSAAKKRLKSRFYGMHKRPNTLVSGSHLFVGLLTDMFRRLPANAHPSPSQFFTNDLLSQKKDALHTYSTIQQKSLHRVQVFHLIPLFSRTRLRVSPQKGRGRAIATKIGAI